MKILLTGANGYVGLRLLSTLLEEGHTVHAVVRDARRLPIDEFAAYSTQLSVVEADLAQNESTVQFPKDIDVAYFLVHSMAGGQNFVQIEDAVARNFAAYLAPTSARQIIYLGGIIPENEPLSPHLESRRNMERILAESAIPLTVLRASIIVGSGSASFEIIRDLVEKLPILIAPRWTRNKCQPIGIRNVLGYLIGVAGNETTFNRSFDIGGREILTYVDLMRGYADERKLRRLIIPVPFLTPRLSSYWLYSMTSTSFRIARALVESLVHDTICTNNSILEIVPQKLLTYREAVENALARIAQNRVPSAWFDSLASGRLEPALLRSIHVPDHGTLSDNRVVPLQAKRQEVIDAVWSLGGKRGWPSMNWAWKIRGLLDRLVGGIGLRRGRRDPINLRSGDVIDFWRVLLVDRPNGRLMLYAEMRLPGEAWLEFEVSENELRQTATFRPLGLFGRLYWLACMPFHAWLFPRMARDLAASH